MFLLREQIARDAAADARVKRYRQQARQLQEEAASARPGATGGSDVANSRNARVEMQVSDDEESISGWSEALDAAAAQPQSDVGRSAVDCFSVPHPSWVHPVGRADLR